MDIKFRCNCPFTSALDILGDKWMLVIIKQMLLENKETFKDFTESDEAIATNILSAKLKLLEELGLVTRSKLPTNKKSVYYHLTDKALDLVPVIVELGIWSDKHLRELHPTIANGQGMEFLRSDKTEFGRVMEDNYRKKMQSTLYKTKRE
jgi:DNA-binding HxlR family transcriptional regulator